MVITLLPMHEFSLFSPAMKHPSHLLPLLFSTDSLPESSSVSASSSLLPSQCLPRVRCLRHRLAGFLLLLALSFSSTSATALTIEQAFPRFYPDRSIESLQQRLGLGSGQTFRSVIPSQKHSPQGWYFLIELDQPLPATAHSARIRLYRTDALDAASHSWPLDDLRPRRMLYLGLTGTDWPEDTAVRPLAWRIEIVDAEGAVLASWESFLYSLP